MKLIVMLAICLPLLAFTVILLADSYSYARETKRRYPKNKEYQREFTSLSLRKQRQEQLDDWERRFRLSMTEEEYRRTVPGWVGAGVPRLDFAEVVNEYYREKLYRLSAGATDSQVRR